MRHLALLVFIPLPYGKATLFGNLILGGSSLANKVTLKETVASQEADRFHSTSKDRNVVLGGWELVERIAEGATAEVFAARPVANANASIDYAVKRLRDCRIDDSSWRRRFANEVACGQVADQENLLPILGAELKTSPMYHVSPLIDGPSVRDVLSNFGRFALPNALWIIRQISLACSALHVGGWIHGDIKPANVIVRPNGNATLVDFGFASRIGGEHHSSACSLNGTLSYAAPERFTSSYAACPASDVYGLGVMLFEMLTGQLPFADHDAGITIQSHIELPAPSIRTYVPALPREVSQLVSRMLAKDPVRRPSANGELQSELIRFETESFALRAF